MIGMKVHNEGLDFFLTKIKRDNIGIICWGAGMMPHYIDDFLEKFGIIDAIKCFGDSDPKKWNQHIEVCGRKIPILSLEKILEIKENKIFLITCEKYFQVIEWLNKIKELDETNCFVYTHLNYEYFKRVEKRNKTKVSMNIDEKLKIPKIIHYCWFGRKEIPSFNLECIESWRRYCPDYEMKQWNEDNYDISKVNYVKQAYEAKKWAFVTDYVRLDVLFQEGGVYFDTDVKLIRNIDDLLKNEAFCVFAEWPAVNSGSGIGAVKNYELLREMRDEPRSYSNFILPNGELDLTTNAFYESAILKKYGLKKDFSLQNIGGMMIYPPNYFAPASVLGNDVFVNEETYGIHYCQGTWKK